MSRKTRKLIWSAPLVAVLAVAGALAMFVALAPMGRRRHIELPGAPQNLTAKADGTRAINLDWSAPTDGGTVATGYRIDRSKDGNEWMSLAPDTGSLASEYTRTPGPQSRSDTVLPGLRAELGRAPGRVPGLFGTDRCCGYTGSRAGRDRLTQTGRNSITVSPVEPPASDGGSDITKYRIHVGDNAVPAVSVPITLMPRQTRD